MTVLMGPVQRWGGDEVTSHKLDCWAEHPPPGARASWTSRAAPARQQENLPRLALQKVAEHHCEPRADMWLKRYASEFDYQSLRFLIRLEWVRKASAANRDGPCTTAQVAGEEHIAVLWM